MVKNLSLLLVATVFAVMGCSPKSNPTGNDTVGGDAVTDASDNTDTALYDASSEALSIEQLLNNPATVLTSATEQPNFGVPEIGALQTLVPALKPLSETPNTHGFLKDPATINPFLKAMVPSRPEQLQIRISAYATGSGAVAVQSCTLETPNGAFLARRIENAEADDKFDLLRPPTKAALRKLTFNFSLADANDMDNFLVDLYLESGKDTTFTLTCGAQVLTIDSAKSIAGLNNLEIDANSAVSVSVIHNPNGNCLNTFAKVATKAYFGSSGRPVGLFYGILARSGVLVGYIRGYYGYSSTENTDVLLFKAIKPNGELLYFGEAKGALSRKRAGRVWTGNTALGAFVVGLKHEPHPSTSPFRVAMSLMIATECKQ